ncbi:MAG: hypothetical protein NTW74_08970 [Acidobacteria bacterium]|nr:hypothetical protein [Acidobacteriota bacterium]
MLQKMMRMMADIWLNQPRVNGGGTSVPSPGAGPSTVPSVGLPGDTGAPAPPPSAPPPPPPGF